MSPPLIGAVIWVLAVSAVGMGPRRYHKRLGFPLLALLVPLTLWLWIGAGPGWALGLIAGALSIYRYPARYYTRALWKRVNPRV